MREKERERKRGERKRECVGERRERMSERERGDRSIEIDR